MGKRKSSKKPQTRIKQVLDKSFRCVFCAHQGSVTCKMDSKNHLGRLDCKDCGQTFTMEINHLSEPIDVYSSWLDACEEANPADAAPAPRSAKAASKPASKKRRAGDDEDEDDVEPEAQASEDDDDDQRDSRPRKLRKGAARDTDVDADEEADAGGAEDEEEDEEE
ncbi:hypothetical protein JCM6882_000174 [Rhodosporidiobolus microsporus]